MDWNSKGVLGFACLIIVKAGTRRGHRDVLPPDVCPARRQNIRLNHIISTHVD
jgi:hypothetical protein